MAFMTVVNGMAMLKNEDGIYSNFSSFNRFGIEFTKVVAKERSGNYVSSPVSVNMVLSMAALGAEGKTKSELRESLHLPTDESAVKDRYEKLIKNLESISDADLIVASKIFTANTFELKNTFKDVTRKYFGSVAQSMDFSKTEESASKINNWAAQSTNNRIKELVKPAHIQNAQMIMANAVYFKGEWADSFPTYLTKSKPFHISETSTKNVDMMSITGEYNWGPISQLGAKYLEIPYKSENASMFIILPNELNGLTNIEENYHQINFDELLNGQKSEVEVYLPKFSFENELNLKTTLQKMNIKDMFETTANFHGINDNAALYANEVIQKTFITVNEEGTEAAAVTEIGMVGSSLGSSEVPKFTVDRPFIAVIVAKFAKTIPLFNARIVDPTA
ncbi:hypothetical protein PV325_008097 [Microctonus aethiopoides]|nr:hypothetical protein PV325_008097 [Microctonus aethiopoides]